MPTAEQLGSTLERIYAAAADPALWENALRAIEDFTGSTGAVLDLVPKASTTHPRTFAGSFSRDDCATYALNYMARCPRIAFGLANPDVRIHYDKLVLTEAEMDRDPVYEWLGKHGLRYYVAGWVGDGQLYRAYLSLQRSHGQGHARPEEVANFALLQRHVEQALSLALKLGTLEQQYRFGLRLLDALPHAIFALDGGGRIVFMNAPAERLVGIGDGLFTDNGRLGCRLVGQQPVLDRLVAAALLSEAEGVRGGWLRLRRASGRRPYLALVSQLVAGEGLTDEFRPRLLVIVTDPDRAVVPDEQALRDLYGLTGAEARVAVALASGHSVQSAAECLHISAETLRSHLKHLFRKLGVGRQQDLVRTLTEIGLVARDATGLWKAAHPNGG
jgi:DNA-binding CsgD family transcriptional regulator/PAS domain-containing protein